jgi:hypothetical protein
MPKPCMQAAQHTHVKQVAHASITACALAAQSACITTFRASDSLQSRVPKTCLHRSISNTCPTEALHQVNRRQVPRFLHLSSQHPRRMPVADTACIGCISAEQATLRTTPSISTACNVVSCCIQHACRTAAQQPLALTVQTQ